MNTASGKSYLMLRIALCTCCVDFELNTNIIKSKKIHPHFEPPPETLSVEGQNIATETLDQKG